MDGQVQPPRLLDQPWRMGVNLSTAAKAHPYLLQPGGLAEGSRWSRGKRGRDHREGARQWNAPRRGARSGCGPVQGQWFSHPSGVQPDNAKVPGGRSPLCPERPPATFYQPFGLEGSGTCLGAGAKVDAHAPATSASQRKTRARYATTTGRGG